MIKVLFLTQRGDRHQQAARRAAPPEIDSLVMLRDPSRHRILNEIVDATILISERRGAIDGDMIRAGSNLRLIQRLGSLVYDIDLEAAREWGVAVCTWPLPGTIAVAEHVIWQMLSLARRSQSALEAALQAEAWGESRRTDEDTFSVNWSDQRGLISLKDQSVGIAGFGEIGTQLARRLRPFGCRVHYHKRTRLPAAVESELRIEYTTADALISRSRFLINLLPYSAETDRFFHSERIAQMRHDAFFVSAGSGSVIDERALADAIQRGHLSGAALDTFEWEPLRPENPLLTLARDPRANVLLTPHTAALHDKDGRRSEYENVRRLLRGEELLFQVTI